MGPDLTLKKIHMRQLRNLIMDCVLDDTKGLLSVLVGVLMAL